MLRWLTAGESHGRALVAICEGMPAGVRELGLLLEAAGVLRLPVLVWRMWLAGQVWTVDLYA